MARTASAFVLIHSPLVGPFTWSLVADELRRRGIEVIVPVLQDSETSDAPYWQQHVDGVVDGLRSTPVDRSLILVGHSGAGPLLPAIGEAVRHPVSGYVFVDAGLPGDGASRLDLLKEGSSAWAQEFQRFLEEGGRFPNWTDDQLQAVVPDDSVRHRLLAELKPRGLRFFTEPIPVRQAG